MLLLCRTGQGEVSAKDKLLNVRKAETSSNAVKGLYAKRLI